MVRWWESVVYASGTKFGDYSEGSSREVDQLSIDIAGAKAAVETALRPYLDAPTFGEFLFPPELVRAIRSAGSVTATLR
jgi:hypothetical protein